MKNTSSQLQLDIRQKVSSALIDIIGNTFSPAITDSLMKLIWSSNTNLQKQKHLESPDHGPNPCLRASKDNFSNEINEFQNNRIRIKENI